MAALQTQTSKRKMKMNKSMRSLPPIVISLCSCLFVLNVFGQSRMKDRFIIVNEGDAVQTGSVVEQSWEPFAKRFGITDTSGFRIIDERKKEEVPLQLETAGTGKVVQLLLLADIPAHDSVIFRVEKGKRKAVVLRTFGRYVPERKDDFAWENDRVGFRMYGKALEGTNENAHGIDVWVKRTRSMVINDRYRRNDYHEDNGDGLDYYSVGNTMGAGNLAPYWKDSVLYPGNYSRWEILDNGPLRTSFRLHYDDVRLDGKILSMSKTISLDAGSYMNRISVVLSSPGMDSIPVVIGIATRKDPGVIHVDERKGMMAYWEPAHAKYGTTGVAVSAKGPGKIRFTPTQMLFRTSVRSSQPYVYHAGACWDREGVITDENKWIAEVRSFHEAQVRGQNLRFKF